MWQVLLPVFVYCWLISLDTCHPSTMHYRLINQFECKFEFWVLSILTSCVLTLLQLTRGRGSSQDGGWWALPSCVLYQQRDPTPRYVFHWYWTTDITEAKEKRKNKQKGAKKSKTSRDKDSDIPHQRCHCGKFYSTIGSLRSHEHQCGICRKRFGRREHLAAHSGDLAYQCTICGKSNWG